MGSLQRYATRRDANELEIVKALRARGASWQSLSIKGCGDGIVGFRGVNYLAEIKTLTGKLTPNETAWHEQWQGQIQVVRTMDEALEMIGAL